MFCLELAQDFTAFVGLGRACARLGPSPSNLVITLLLHRPCATNFIIWNVAHKINAFRLVGEINIKSLYFFGKSIVPDYSQHIINEKPARRRMIIADVQCELAIVWIGLHFYLNGCRCKSSNDNCSRLIILQKNYTAAVSAGKVLSAAWDTGEFSGKT